MIKPKFSVILLVVFLQLTFSQDLILNKYSLREGLPTQEITGVVQDSSGFIWISSKNGLAKYDTHEWKVFNPENFNLIKTYTHLVKDAKNNIWAVSQLGDRFIVKIKDDIPEIIDLPDKYFREIDFVKEIKVLNDNDLQIFIFTSSNKILHFYKNKWKWINSDNAGILFSIELYDNKLLVSSSKGIYKLVDNLLVNFDPIDENKFSNVRYLKSKNINGQQILFLLSEKKLYKYQKQKIKFLSDDFVLDDFDLMFPTYYLDVNSKGHIFFGNRSHIYCLTNEGKILKDYLNLNELQFAGAAEILIDSEDLIWLTTMRGIFKLVQTPFADLPNADLINNNEIPAIHKTVRGEIVIGQYGRISVYKNGKVKTYTLPGNQFVNSTTARIMDITSDKNGVIYFTVVPNGVFELKNNKVKNIIDLKKYDFSTLLFDGDNLILGSAKGLYEFSSGEFKVINDNLSAVRRIKKLDENLLGICTAEYGLYLKQGNKIENFKSKSRLLSSTYDILKISEDRFWVATKDGLVELDKATGNYNRIFKREITEQIYSINREDDGTIWLGSNNGFLKIKDEKIVKYNTSIGLKGNEANRAAFVIENESRIWLGTDRGLSIYDKNFGELPEYSPKAVITEVSVDGIKIADFSNRIEVENKAKVVVQFRGLSYLNERENSHKLKLYDESNKLVFEQESKKNFIELFALKPGKYRLLVWTKSPVFIESETPAVVDFLIKEDFYSSIWLYLIIFFGSSIFTLGVYYFVNQRNYSKRLEEEVLEKTKLLKDEIKQKNTFEEQLKQSEEKYKGLFDHSVIGIFQIDLDGNFITVNQSCLKLLGFENIDNISALPNFSAGFKDSESGVRFLSRIIKNSFLIGEQLSIIRQDNSSIELRCNARLISDSKNSFIEGTLEDITQTIIAKEALLNAKQKAENSEKIKTEFLAQMSHEIRTPINVILSFSQLLKEEINENLASEFDDFFAGMDKAGRRIIRTIDLLLNVSELQTGGYDYNPKKLNLLNDILSPLYSEYKTIAKEKNLDLKLSCKDYLEFFGDEYTIMQIFANLIDNALKYTEEGSVEILGEFDNGVKISIKDTGIGISEEYIPQLFTPFTQEEQGYTRKYEGNGLGLTLVKKYCDLNNASLNVESVKGEGTTISVRFIKKN